MKNGFIKRYGLKLMFLSLLLLLSGIFFFVPNKQSKANAFYQVPTISSVQGYSGQYDNLFHDIKVNVKYFNGTVAENYSYQWYKGGISSENMINGATQNTFKVKNVADSDIYFCKVVFTTDDGGSYVFSSQIEVNISPINLVNNNLILDTTEAVYNKTNHKPNLTIRPFVNQSFDEDDYEIKYIYENDYQTTRLLDFIDETMFVDAGVYYIRMIASQNSNYTGYAEQIFRITPIKVVPLEMGNYNTISKIYDGTADVNTEIKNLEHYYLSGVLQGDSVIPEVLYCEYNHSSVNGADEIYAIIKLSGKDIINYIVDEDLILTNVKIRKREVWVYWGNTHLTYSGEPQVPSVSFYNGVEKFGNIEYTYSKKYTDVGSYTAEIIINNPNMVVVNSKQDFTINPYKISVDWRNCDLVYNGQIQSPTVGQILDLNDKELAYTISGAKKVAGKHVAEIVFNSKNYAPSNGTKTKEFVINPYVLELEWKDSEFVFNNAVQYPSYEIKNPLEDNLLIQVVGGGRYIGQYTCQAIVSNINYEIKNNTHRFAIVEKSLSNDEVVVSGEILSDYALNITQNNAKNVSSPKRNYEVLKSYNIEIAKDGKAQENSGYLYTINIRLENDKINKNLKVFHVLKDGSIEELKVDINNENQTISFKVGGFSEFLICVPEEESVALIVICSIILSLMIAMLLFWLIKKYNVSFVTNGGGNAEILRVRCLESFGLPNNLKRRGYVFEGWYLEPEMITRYEKNYFRLKNLTLYANWQENKSAILEELEKDIKKNSKLQDLVISKRNIKMFISFADLLEKLADVEGNRKKVIYKIIPVEKGYNILNSELKEVVAWCKNFTDAKFLGKILALEDNTKLIIINKAGKEIKKIELNKIKHEMCLFKKFYNVYETKKQNKYNIYNVNGEWYIKKNNEIDACAFARYKKDIIRIGAIYSLIEKSKLILYSNNGKIKKEIKVVYK